MTPSDTDTDDEDYRPIFNAIAVTFLDCMPGNYDRHDGEPASIITIGRKSTIEPLVFSMADTRVLVTKLLVSLASCEDEFAKNLLDNNFGAGDDGHFEWPKDWP